MNYPPSSSSNSSSPLYFCEPQFSELLWENGQIIVTHDHTAQPTSKFPQLIRHDVDAAHTSTSITTTTTATTSIGLGNGNGYGYGISSIGKPNIDILSADAHADDDNTVPWMHFSHHDPLPFSSPLPSDDFCSDFIEGFAGATSSSMAFGFPFPPAQSTAAAGTSAAAAAAAAGISTTATAPAPAPAPAPTPLSKGDTGAITNFSLFKDRLASGARASTSTKHTNYAPANQKETTTTHDQPLLPLSIAPSSVGSVNGEGAHNTEPKRAGKRKVTEADDSSSNTEDTNDKSAGEKRIPTGRSSSAKKSRAAEVHNLSERRRRERINEKMKALQELIPNCSKADKASMLDDAIEYLKTLQLQVQMMSMGNGMYMPPPVKVPPMMQPLRAPHMAHYSSLGMGFYQMGMYPQLQPQQFMQGPPPMHGFIAPMPVNPQAPVPASVNTQQPTTVVSSSEKAATAVPDTSVGSTYVRESTGAANPAKPDPKTEML